MGTIHVIQPDGEEQTWESSAIPERGVLKEIVGDDLLFQLVLYKDKCTHMISPPFSRSEAPVNHAATRIYQADLRAGMRRGENIDRFGPPDNWEKVHGAVVVLEDIDL